jgi:hypothetical protein
MRNRNTIEQEVRDRLPLADMDASCQEVARVLRATIDQALDEESKSGPAR